MRETISIDLHNANGKRLIEDFMVVVEFTVSKMGHCETVVDIAEVLMPQGGTTPPLPIRRTDGPVENAIWSAVIDAVTDGDMYDELLGAWMDEHAHDYEEV